MSRYWLIPLVVVCLAIVGLLALGIPGGAPTPVPYEKTLPVIQSDSTK